MLFARDFDSFAFLLRNRRLQESFASNEARKGKLIRSASGNWNRKQSVWEQAYGEVIAIGSEKKERNEKDKNWLTERT